MSNNDNDNDNDNASPHGGKFFTPLQARPFWAPVAPSTVALCPSMDLWTLGLVVNHNHSSSTNNNNNIAAHALWLHRSLDFHQLAAVTDTKTALCAATWRPDGRWVAVATCPAITTTTTTTDHSRNANNNNNNHNIITLYHVEAIMTHGTDLPAFVESSLMGPVTDNNNSSNNSNNPAILSTALTASGNILQYPVDTTTNAANDNNNIINNNNTPDTIQALVWVHCVAPTTGASLYERLWRRQQHHHHNHNMLPPSAYHAPPDHWPSLQQQQQQPLSLLMGVTAHGRLYVYLLGHYPLLQGVALGNIHHHHNKAGDTQLVASHDVTHTWIYKRQGNTTTTTTSNKNNIIITLHSLPRALGLHRYLFQNLAVAYTHVVRHLTQLPPRLTEVRDTYRSALTPLDGKWTALQRLLRNYHPLDAAAPDIPQWLVRYIMWGHGATTATDDDNLANAMDQFFTSMHMNDQLIQRMDRSLTVAVANVESLLRQFLAACQALLIQVDALLGIAQATSTPRLLPIHLVATLHANAQRLVLATEAALTALIESRFRLRDWIAWMRATGSAIKARGTDLSSALRDNAKKRRISDATLHRVLGYLQEAQSAAVVGATTDPSATGLSDSIMGLTAARYWAPNDTTVWNRPDLWTLPHALQETHSAAVAVFEAPQEYMTQVGRRRQWRVALPSREEEEEEDCLVAITSRQGALWNGAVAPHNTWKYPTESNDQSNHKGCFTVATEPRTDKEHQWTLIAQALPDISRVNLYALPLTTSMETLNDSGEPVWDEFDDSDDDEEPDKQVRLELSPEHCDSLQSYYLTASLELPDHCRVVDMVFFGDDGKSTLYTPLDKPLQEQRQSLGLLVRRKGSEGDDSSLELWVIPDYDGCHWETHQTPTAVWHGEKGQNDPLCRTLFLAACKAEPTPLRERWSPEEEDGEEQPEEIPFQKTLYAKIRQLSSSSSTADPRLFVSGSRGIATVVENQATHSRVGIWDLNEDEEEDEDGEEPDVEMDTEDAQD